MWTKTRIGTIFGLKVEIQYCLFSFLLNYKNPSFLLKRYLGKYNYTPVRTARPSPSRLLSWGGGARWRGAAGGDQGCTCVHTGHTTPAVRVYTPLRPPLPDYTLLHTLVTPAPSPL